MKKQNIAAVVTASLAFLLGSAVLCRASALAEGKGSVSGTAKGEDGKPIAGLSLRLEFDDPVVAGTHGGKDNPKSGGGGSTPHTKIVGRATTDKDGNFTFTDIEPGTYRLVAGNKQIGWIYQDVEIKANEQNKLGELKLVKVK